jgi:hypothetical protein
MPWGELKKEDLIKAGLNPDEINALSGKIANAATKDDITSMQSALTETQNTLKNLEATLRTLNASKEGGDDGNRGGNNDSNRGNNNGGGNNQPQPLNIDPLEFMENPTASVRKLANEMLAPVTLHTLNVAADMAYNMARQRLPHFDKFEPEIKELWNKYTPAQKGRPDELIENIYNLVRGRHLDDILTDTAKKEGKFNLVQSGGTTVVGSQNGGSSRKPEDDLTEKEKEVAARFGLTPKEWAEQKGGLKYV